MNNQRKRVTIPELSILANSLKVIDRHIISSVAKRMKIAKLVEQRKRLEDSNQPIIRTEIEKNRIEQAGAWAEEFGLDSNLGQMIQQILILKACHVQMDEREHGLNREDEKLFDETKEDWLKHLRNNLLELTSLVAPNYDQMYTDAASFATKTYLEYEQTVIEREITALTALNNNKLMLDLGCANGRFTFKLADKFKEIVGVDISPAMIEAANKKNDKTNVSFQLDDINNVLSKMKNCVSLAIANLGTASEIYDERIFLANLSAALCEDGRFVLSFYNRNAIHQQCFMPWQIPLSAEFDTIKRCLNVNSQTKDFLIYARPYTVEEIRNMFKKSSLSITEITTYPIVSSIFPQECLTDEQNQKIIEKIDHQLLNSGSGTYILVNGRKTK